MNKQPIAIDTYCITGYGQNRLQVNFYIDPNRFEEETVTSKRKTLYFTESVDTLLLDGIRGKLEQYCHDNGITVDRKTKFNITQINKTSIDFTVTHTIRKSYVDLLLDALKNLEV